MTDAIIGPLPQVFSTIMGQAHFVGRGHSL